MARSVTAPEDQTRSGPCQPFPAASAHAAYRRVAIMQASGISVRPATRSTVLAPGLGRHAQAWPAPLPGRGWSRRCYPSNAGTGAATNAPYSSHLRRSPRGPAGQRPPRRHHDVREGQQGSVLLPSPTTSGLCRVEVPCATSAAGRPAGTGDQSGVRRRHRGHMPRLMRLRSPARRRSRSVVSTLMAGARRAADLRASVGA